LSLKKWRFPNGARPGAHQKQKSSFDFGGSDTPGHFKREHLGKGRKDTRIKNSGMKPAGQVVNAARHEEIQGRRPRGRIPYSGCGLCNDCRRGYMISCTSPLRAPTGGSATAHGAVYPGRRKRTWCCCRIRCRIPTDAQVACGFGTSTKGYEKIGVSGNDAVLVVGLGPVGLATLRLAKAMGAQRLIGVDITEERAGSPATKTSPRTFLYSRPRYPKKISI